MEVDDRRVRNQINEGDGSENNTIPVWERANINKNSFKVYVVAKLISKTYFSNPSNPKSLTLDYTFLELRFCFSVLNQVLKL